MLITAKINVRQKKGELLGGAPLFNTKNGDEIWMTNHWCKYVIVKKEDQFNAREGKKIEVRVLSESEMEILRNLYVTKF